MFGERKCQDLGGRGTETGWEAQSPTAPQQEPGVHVCGVVGLSGHVRVCVRPVSPMHVSVLAPPCRGV